MKIVHFGHVVGLLSVRYLTFVNITYINGDCNSCFKYHFQSTIVSFLFLFDQIHFLLDFSMNYLLKCSLECVLQVNITYIFDLVCIPIFVNVYHNPL